MSVRFSVLMPAFNREKYVRQAIDSVLSQSFTDYELFVVDDGSTDKTVQTIESYGTKVKLLRQSNQGPEVARGMAASLAQGEYLVFLDSDDLLLPRALATYDRIIRSFERPSLIIGAMTNFQDGQPMPADSSASLPVMVLKFRDYLSKDISLALSSSRIVVRKSVFDEVGGLRRTTAKTFHLDSLNFILKVCTYGPCIVVRQPSTVAYRHHETNAIRSLEPITEGILVLARTEHQGLYPGGKARRQERYVPIGAIAFSWAFSYCLRKGRLDLTFRLLWSTAPMIFAGLMKKFTGLFRSRMQPIGLPEQ
jgi:glycosyltransferase involved in cell wall biosynthesis